MGPESAVNQAESVCGSRGAVPFFVGKSAKVGVNCRGEFLEVVVMHGFRFLVVGKMAATFALFFAFAAGD
jgi:hypothetical protein